MSAAIVVDDGTNPPVTGSVDLGVGFLATLFTLSNFNDSAVLGWRWTLVDKPIGSAASLATPTAATTTLTPDVPGGYLVRLETFLDVPATVADDVDEQVIRIRFAAPLDWGVPAAGETVQLDASRGWATPREEGIRDTRQNLNPPPTGTPVALGFGGTTTMVAASLLLYDPSAGTHTIEAPATPVLGDRFAIKNATVSAVAVTIDGNGNPIEDPGSGTIIASFSLGMSLVSIDYIYDGTNWIIL